MEIWGRVLGIAGIREPSQRCGDVLQISCRLPGSSLLTWNHVTMLQVARTELGGVSQNELPSKEDRNPQDPETFLHLLKESSGLVATVGQAIQ